MRRMRPEVKNLVTSKKPLVIVPVVLALVLAGLFLPVKVSIEPYGVLSLETKITISIGYEVAYASPGTEVRQPDGDIDAGLWTATPLWSKIDEGSSAPDGEYIVCPGKTTSTGECSIQDPTNAGTYGSVQIKVYACKSAPGGNQRGLDADIRINGALQGSQILQADLTETFNEYTYTWTGLNFSQTEMNSLQILFISTGATVGGPTVRREVWIDYYETVLSYEVLDITNLPTSKAFGLVNTSTDYWAKGPAPTFPLDDAECFFEVTNNSLVPVKITIRATDFSGGIAEAGWDLGATPGADTVVLKTGKSGDELETDMVTLTTSDQTFIASLDASSSKMWELKMETPTSFSNGDPKTSTVTLTAMFP